MKTFAGLKEELNNRQTVCIGDIFTDAKTKRIHIMFAEKPCEQMRQALKSHGFGWYPKQNTWSKNWTAEDEKFARTFVRQCNSNVANKTNTIINFPKKSDTPKAVKAVADTVKTAPKTVKKQVKAVKAVKTVPSKVQTNAKKANAITERDGIKVGDIFYDVHGYNMTWYNFYKVIGFKGQKTVVFAQIEKKQIDGCMGMYGSVIPVDQYFYHDYRNTGIVEKIVKEGGKTPVFKGGNLYRHVAGRTYYENHLD